MKEENEEYLEAAKKGNAVEVADALGDMLYILSSIFPPSSLLRFLALNKAKELLNYNPQFSISQGLKEAVKWYWENLK